MQLSHANFDSTFIRSLDARTYWIATKAVCDLKLDELIADRGRKEACVEAMNHSTATMWNFQIKIEATDAIALAKRFGDIKTASSQLALGSLGSEMPMLSRK